MADRAYIVVTSSSPDDLAEKVNDLIYKGYQPIGGIAAVPRAAEAGVRSAVDYLQAMTLKKKGEK